MADAAREAGAEIRTGAPVARVIVRGNRAVGVALADGTEIGATAIVASTDPRRTFLQLVDAVDLDPGFLTKIRNYRVPGTVSKVDFALGALPAFRGIANAADLRGRIQIGDSIDYLERAFDASKYREISEEPYLDITFPSLHDSALAPQGRHVMSVYVQYTPYHLAAGAWPAAEESLAATVLKTIEEFAPGVSTLVEARRVVSPRTLESVYGLTGGHVLHGEPSLDQIFTMRPVLNWAQYRSPIDGLFMCGSGTHPGGGLTAASGQNAAREIIAALKRARRT